MNAPAASLRAAIWLGLAVAIGRGVTRFGYALVMPAMQADLHWGHERASWINTANALGYILGTTSGFVLLRWTSNGRLFRAGLLLTVASLPLMAVSSSFSWLVVLRLVSGLGTAWSFSTGGVLVSQIYANEPKRKGAATGLFFGGAGLGMVISGAVVPAILEWRGPSGWALAWLVLGALCTALVVFPLGIGHGAVSAAEATSDGNGSLRFESSWRVLLGYAGFGAAHTGYVFFIFAWAHAEHLPWYHGAGMWMVMGAAVFSSAWIWKRPLGKWQASNALALCNFICAAAVVLPVVAGARLPVVYLSAACMGASMFIAPASMAVLARQTLPAATWGKALMVYALVFSLGQAIGSWAFGRAADVWSLQWVLGAASAGLLVSGLLAATGLARQNRRSVALGN
ncbi:YbfB/YjiJ family MFS transporter [Caenimonas soli]|uniref:YbfB/YjiJ family MFS transporter n=1 Tax=Caenimonas soli TaxID=2735555 RepID=UPI001551A721|nr:YbfB/YjiJ family MFS transporter [Caenimonas soli]NPC59157.1 YbfB/YjiJ family MFS transporter [Caenimonas soli]